MLFWGTGHGRGVLITLPVYVWKRGCVYVGGAWGIVWLCGDSMGRWVWGSEVVVDDFDCVCAFLCELEVSL